MAMLSADQQGWSKREGELLKYRVNLRFGEELVSPPPAPNQKADLRFDGDEDTMPAGLEVRTRLRRGRQREGRSVSSFTVAAALIR